MVSNVTWLVTLQILTALIFYIFNWGQILFLFFTLGLYRGGKFKIRQFPGKHFSLKYNKKMFWLAMLHGFQRV